MATEQKGVEPFNPKLMTQEEIEQHALDLGQEIQSFDPVHGDLERIRHVFRKL